MKKLTDSDLLALLPPHIAEDPQFAAAAEAVAPHLAALTQAIPNLLIFSRLGGHDPSRMLPPLRRITAAAGGVKTPETELLESLAWQFHVDFREAARNDSELAGMVRNSIAWHRIKGTPASIKAALALFGYTAAIEEDGTGDLWATWQLGLPQLADMETVRHIWTIAHEMQPARCALWRMYTDVYDWRPGIWSGGLEANAPINAEDTRLCPHCWSYFWWSLYSGVPVAGIPGVDDDHNLIVSFGKRDLYQAEQYLRAALCAGVGLEERRSYRIPYMDRFIWSHSCWGDVYRYNTAFTIGQLLSLLAGVPVHTGGMAVRNWYRAQLVWSWPGVEFPPDCDAPHRDGTYGEINSTYSLPTVAIAGPSPVWSDFLWSDVSSSLQYLDILQQFHDISAHLGARPDIRFSGQAAVESLRAFSIPYEDAARWSQFAYGDTFPQNHPFALTDGLATIAAEPVWEATPWQGAWDDRPWGKIVAMEPPRQQHNMAVQPWCRSQLVHSWPGVEFPSYYNTLQNSAAMDGGEPHSANAAATALAASEGECPAGRGAEPYFVDGTYGEINSTYSRPTVQISGAAPVWGDFAWSNEEPAITIVEVAQQEQRTTGHTSQSISPAPQDLCGVAVGRAHTIPYTDHPVWGQFCYSDAPLRHNTSFAIRSTDVDLHEILHVLAPGCTLTPGELWDAWGNRITESMLHSILHDNGQAVTAVDPAIWARAQTTINGGL